MHSLVLFGAGKIGRMITRFLSDCGDYDLLVCDADQAALDRLEASDQISTRLVDAGDRNQIMAALQGRAAVVSALSFRFNPLIAQCALDSGASYFDLTEDVETTRLVSQTAESAKQGQIFMPQCGLAPGFISIVAHTLAQQFDQVDAVRMRVGALPQFPTGSLKYNLTWSTDGLINEYCNPCEAIHRGQLVNLLPLEGLEHFSLDGVRYEAFNTSGGLGTLCETLREKVRELNYKTIRYQGHREMMALLVDELRLGEQRELLKEMLERAVPITFQDVVVTFCTVTGHRDGQFVQTTDARKIYNETIGDDNWSAIQITTAAGICAVIDLHFRNKLAGTGFVRQETVPLEEFLANRFGQYYDSKLASRFVRNE